MKSVITEVTEKVLYSITGLQYEVEVLYNNDRIHGYRTYKYGTPQTVKKFMETHECKVHEYEVITYRVYK